VEVQGERERREVVAELCMPVGDAPPRPRWSRRPLEGGSVPETGGILRTSRDRTAEKRTHEGLQPGLSAR